ALGLESSAAISPVSFMATGGGRSSAESWWPMPPGEDYEEPAGTDGEEIDSDSQRTLFMDGHTKPASSVPSETEKDKAENELEAGQEADTGDAEVPLPTTSRPKSNGAARQKNKKAGQGRGRNKSKELAQALKWHGCDLGCSKCRNSKGVGCAVCRNKALDNLAMPLAEVLAEFKARTTKKNQKA
ncbi:unnamed protein product, partial [Symbiodinium pilosum]